MLIGNLGNNPEKRMTSGGAPVVTLSIATTEKWKDKSGMQQEKTEWHRVVLWNRLADLAEQYLRKGSKVYIEGSIYTNEYTDKDGNKRYSTEIRAREMKFLDSRPQQGQGQEQSGHPSQNQFSGGMPPQSQTNQNYGGGHSGAPQPQYQQPSTPPAAAQAPPQATPQQETPTNSSDFIEDDIPF